MKIHSPVITSCSAKTIGALFVITLLAALSYLGTLHSPFIYDDQHSIVTNPYIQKLEKFHENVDIRNILNRSFVLLSYAVNWKLGDLNVVGYHFLNLMLHVFVGITLFFLTAELLYLEPPESRTCLKNLPFFVSIIHVFNPMAVESVAYLSSRSSLLVTLFFLLSFLYWLRVLGRSDEGKLSMKKFHGLFLVVVFLFLGSASKAIIVTMPIMGAIYLWLKPSGFSLRKNRSVLVIVLLPLFAYLGYRTFKFSFDPSGTFIFHNPFVIQSSYTMDWLAYLLTQIKVVVFYYGLKLLLPINLNFEPDIKMVSALADPKVLSAAGIILLIGVFFWREESRLIRFALVWAMVTILPTSSFIPLKQLAAEHRTYLPGFGIYILIGVWILKRGYSTWMVRPLIPCILILMCLLTTLRGLDYRTEVLLWQDTARKSPGKALVHNNLAISLINEKSYDQAMQSIDNALNLDPQFIPAYKNRGHVYFQMGHFDKAQEIFDKLIFFGVQDTNTYYNAGMALVGAGRNEEAISYFQKGLVIDGHSPFLRIALGNVYNDLKNYNQALKEYRRVLKYYPDHLEAWNNIGVIFWKLKFFVRAEQQFNKVLAIDEKHAEANKNLAATYMLQGKFRKAIPYLKRHIGLFPNNAHTKDLLLIAETLQHEEAP